MTTEEEIDKLKAEIVMLKANLRKTLLVIRSFEISFYSDYDGTGIDRIDLDKDGELLAELINTLGE